MQWSPIPPFPSYMTELAKHDLPMCLCNHSGRLISRSWPGSCCLTCSWVRQFTCNALAAWSANA